MIDYNIEFAKGILFIRLCGILNLENEKDILNEIIDVIEEGGIKYLVININELEMEDDVTIFDRCKSVIENNDGKMLICGNEFVDNFDFAPDELSAIKILSTC
ncbi:MAG: hypothetical protein J6O62_03620 [Bacilli bacterium]|nr:hypothetical protein [Bacilli bacterium]MBO6194930.1 hypothetical protein [Bacilli bacterium]